MLVILDYLIVHTCYMTYYYYMELFIYPTES
jgi:hypothetical protein